MYFAGLLNRKINKNDLKYFQFLSLEFAELIHQDSEMKIFVLKKKREKSSDKKVQTVFFKYSCIFGIAGRIRYAVQTNLDFDEANLHFQEVVGIKSEDLVLEEIGTITCSTRYTVFSKSIGSKLVNKKLRIVTSENSIMQEVEVKKSKNFFYSNPIGIRKASVELIKNKKNGKLYLLGEVV